MPEKSPEKTKTRQPLKKVETLTHDEASRLNIPTAEYESLIQKEYQDPLRVAYDRRNRDLDPQLVWRGKDQQDWSDLVVNAPPIYIQEKVHPKALIDDLVRRTKAAREAGREEEDNQFNLFADFNGLPTTEAKTEFYQHEANWTNRMILGDSLQVMASLAEREGLRGKVQCIYIDPPYGIKFNSNFQWSTTSHDVKDGNTGHITREPEQVKAFRDTWRGGVHSYLTYLRDRLTVARDLLTESGSIFVQIGDENVHRIRAVLDEVFGSENFCQLIPFRKKLMPLGATLLEGMCDYLLWYSKNAEVVKFRHLYRFTEMTYDGRWRNVEYLDGTRRRLTGDEAKNFGSLPANSKVYRLVSQRAPSFSEKNVFDLAFGGRVFKAPGCWVCSKENMQRLATANRLEGAGDTLSYIYYNTDFPYSKVNNMWNDTYPVQEKEYVVQTSTFVVPAQPPTLPNSGGDDGSLSTPPALRLPSLAHA
jgi:adenine-specific DNA-methyltransferase